MVETQLIDVFCDIKSTKKGGKCLEFKCPYCKNYTKKGEIKKRGGDVYHSHGFVGSSPTQRSPHCSTEMLEKKGVPNDFEFRLNY